MPICHSDLRLARYILQTNEEHYKVVAVKNGRFLGGQRGTGIVPLLTLVDRFGSKLKGASVADRIVGLAAAYVVVLQQVAAVHGNICSKDALYVMREHGIETSNDQVVSHIAGRDGKGRCVMEQQALLAKNASDAVFRIRQLVNK